MYTVYELKRRQWAIGEGRYHPEAFELHDVKYQLYESHVPTEAYTSIHNMLLMSWYCSLTIQGQLLERSFHKFKCEAMRQHFKRKAILEDSRDDKD